jgi:hypothetical protein
VTPKVPLEARSIPSVPAVAAVGPLENAVAAVDIGAAGTDRRRIGGKSGAAESQGSCKNNCLTQVELPFHLDGPPRQRTCPARQGANGPSRCDGGQECELGPLPAGLAEHHTRPAVNDLSPPGSLAKV